MIYFGHKGDFLDAENFLKKAKKATMIDVLDKYGRDGVAALSSATPVETGKTAASWSYEIVEKQGYVALEFHNQNINKGIPIAVIIQYGHGTGTGGWVEGIDYINPAIQPIFDEISKNIWKEVTRL